MDKTLVADLEAMAIACQANRQFGTQAIVERAITELKQAARWQSLASFQSEANEGWCWIVHKGRVTEAYHDHEQKFRFHRLSDNCFMSECISVVMPWDRPEPPTEQTT